MRNQVGCAGGQAAEEARKVRRLKRHERSGGSAAEPLSHTCPATLASQRGALAPRRQASRSISHLPAPPVTRGMGKSALHTVQRPGKKFVRVSHVGICCLEAHLYDRIATDLSPSTAPTFLAESPFKTCDSKSGLFETCQPTPPKCEKMSLNATRSAASPPVQPPNHVPFPWCPQFFMRKTPALHPSIITECQANKLCRSLAPHPIHRSTPAGLSHRRVRKLLLDPRRTSKRGSPGPVGIGTWFGSAPPRCGRGSW